MRCVSPLSSYRPISSARSTKYRIGMPPASSSTEHPSKSCRLPRAGRAPVDRRSVLVAGTSSRLRSASIPFPGRHSVPTCVARSTKKWQGHRLRHSTSRTRQPSRICPTKIRRLPKFAIFGTRRVVGARRLVDRSFIWGGTAREMRLPLPRILAARQSSNRRGVHQEPSRAPLVLRLPRRDAP